VRAYSLDLRQRVVKAARQGRLSNAEVALRFEVGLATVKRYKKLEREGGLAARVVARPGPAPRIRPEDEPALRAQVLEHDDDTLERQCERWAEATGVRVSPSTMCRALKRLGLTTKKSRWARASATRPLERRGGWR
jgi:putative transposase